MTQDSGQSEPDSWGGYFQEARCHGFAVWEAECRDPYINLGGGIEATTSDWKLPPDLEGTFVMKLDYKKEPAMGADGGQRFQISTKGLREE